MRLGERKLKILSAIIDIYIKTGEPVGSKILCHALDFSVSSATIRNEMSDLVELGLLEQPHTSAGRIPSSQGYRLYINELMKLKPISDEEQRFIYGNLSAKAGDPDQLLDEASQILAGITKFAAVSTSPSDMDAKVKSIQFVQTGHRSGMLVLMASSGSITSRNFRCDYELTTDVLRLYHGVFNQKFKGIALTSITPAFIQATATSIGELTLLLSDALVAFWDAARQALKTDVRLEGQMNLLFLPGFEIDSAKRTLDFLNRRDSILKLLNSQTGGVKVLVGLESEQPELIDSSIVIARYSLGDKEAGTIGVVGPTRMDYAKLITSIEYLASTVGELLSDLMEIN